MYITEDGRKLTEEEFNDYLEANKPEPTYVELRKEKYDAAYSDGDVKDIMMKQLNYMRMNGVDLIQEADDYIGYCLSIKSEIPKPEEAQNEHTSS